MAVHTTDLPITRSFLSHLGTGLWSWLETVAERGSRRADIERLNACSDAELAALGIRRDQIAHYVFRDLYHF